MRDKVDIGFENFADAAGLRSRGALFVAMRRGSPKQSFLVAAAAQTNTELSLPAA